MEEIRFNLFKSAHKGLRALLADTLLQLQQTDFLIGTHAEAAITKMTINNRIAQYAAGIFVLLACSCMWFTPHHSSSHWA